LINLSQLIHNKQQNSWPKWLKKKSYFKKSTLFYHFYAAATTGKSIDHLLLGTQPIQPAEEERKRPRRKSSSPKGKPAFSTKTKGGIFGFKK
jgi:poly(A) polymerase